MHHRSEARAKIKQAEELSADHPKSLEERARLYAEAAVHTNLALQEAVNDLADRLRRRPR